ncbi:hypothetical protein [Saccharopolyspora sp. ASAGF58]|uniref:hypothetical protein n=1 Tax=Saccharopolyspora sp. ASAGF58 TaxID=2719023 RepID=UPI0014401081|nr:hypothetical protein [Saccharopolyspora sp. ASAGF58]QIZ35325.1 hypothetical protein FDZ84_12175 [Saccharopolyspora sp. ASAGF58]
MASYFEVYFADQGDPEGTVEHIERIIGLKFEPIEKPYADYRAIRALESGHSVTFELALQNNLDSEADEDHGIPFKEMPRVLTVRGPRSDEEQHKQTTQDVFIQLKESGYKPIYFVYDLDQVIELWDPDQKGDPEVMEFWESEQKGDHGRPED